MIYSFEQKRQFQKILKITKQSIQIFKHFSILPSIPTRIFSQTDLILDIAMFLQLFLSVNQQMLRYLLLTLLLINAFSFKEENNMYALQQSDWPTVLSVPFIMIKFYTPWCTHCKAFEPTYQELIAKMAITHPEVKFAQIDAEANPSIQALYKVQGFPTLIFLKSGKDILFGGTRTVQFMEFWIQKRINDPVVALDYNEISTLESNGQVNIVFYGDINSPQGTVLNEIAKNDNFNLYFYVAEADGKQDGSVQIYRPFGPVETTKTVDYNIKAWLALHERPLVYPFDERASGDLFNAKKNAIILVTPYGPPGVALRAAFEEAAIEWKIKSKKRLIFTAITPEQESFTKFPEYIKIDAAIHPLIYVKGAEKLKYLYPGKLSEITSAKIIEFIKGAQAKKVKKYKLEEETRPNPPPKTSQEL